jgi:amino acid permease
MVGLLVPHTDERLLGANPFIDVQASPFVIALNRANIPVFPDIVNVVILISVLSIGNSCVYSGSRTLTALAEQGYTPRIFAYVDRAGRPLMSTILIIAFGLLAYVNLSASRALLPFSHGVQFAWLTSAFVPLESIMVIPWMKSRSKLLLAYGALGWG